MATFRSEFNSEPNTYNHRLTAFRKKLTTCFQQLRQELLKLHLHQHQHQHQHQQQQEQKKRGVRLRADWSALGEKVNYLRKFKAIFAARQKFAGARAAGGQPQAALSSSCISQTEKVKEEEQQLQIVATLFSSTLISKQYSTISSDMTILEHSYVRVRDDYPDIDAEIRAILLTNAQNGITISSIKNEYRQLTGTAFPLLDNVTDFLLTIPHVTAECCESGKRIFNIKPTEETRHLHEMIVRQRQRDNGPHVITTEQEPPRLWRAQYKRHMSQNLNFNLHGSEKPPVDKPMANRQPLATVAATPNFIYQDNWKHLNNQYQLPQLNAPNNNMNNIKNINKIHTIASNPARQQAEEPPQSAQPSLPSQPAQLADRQQKHLEVEYTHKRRHEFTPTPTTLSCPSPHDSMFTINSDYDAYLLDFPLLGDDFLLYLARMELKCRFKKYERVLQSGLCISGQTINAARQRVHHVDLPEQTQIIVNIGSVDILRGKPLVQIEHDFRHLIKEMHNRRFRPVLTTLAPLANYCHDKQTCEKVSRFNKFIRNEARHLKVIDIHSCLINENGVVRFDCFQNGPRSVTGSAEPHVFWNKIGRQRVLQMIEENLEYY